MPVLHRKLEAILANLAWRRETRNAGSLRFGVFMNSCSSTARFLQTLHHAVNTHPGLARHALPNAHATTTLLKLLLGRSRSDMVRGPGLPEATLQLWNALASPRCTTGTTKQSYFASAHIGATAI